LLLLGDKTSCDVLLSGIKGQGEPFPELVDTGMVTLDIFLLKFLDESLTVVYCLILQIAVLLLAPNLVLCHSLRQLLSQQVLRLLPAKKVRIWLTDILSLVESQE